MRFLRAFTAGAVAISMTGTPVLAQSASPPSAAPVSVVNSVSRSSAAMDDTNALHSQVLIGIFVVIALGLAAILIPEITKPKSP